MKRPFPAIILVLVMMMSAGCSLGKAVADSASGQPQSAGTLKKSWNDGNTGLAANKEPLRIGWWGSQTRHTATLAVLELYTKKTGVQFEPEFYSFDDYISKLNTLMAANDCPDIMQMGGNFPTYMEQIELLNGYIEKGIIDTTKTDKSFIAITTLDGKTVGLSLGTNAHAIAYDPALFNRAGVALPTNKWTWTDYENTAITIHRNLDILGSSQLDEFTVLTLWLQQYDKGESFFLEPYRLKLNYAKDDEITEFFALKERLTRLGAYPSPAQMAEIKNIEADPLVTGKAAMTWITSNQFVALSAAAKRPLALVMPPRRMYDGPLAQTITSSQMFSIWKGSKKKEAAAKFINYFVNDTEANLILKGERGVPIMKPVRDALSASITPENKAVYDYLDQIGKEAAMQITLNSPVQTDIKDIYKSLSEEVVFGMASPAEAAVKLRVETEKILKRAVKAND